MYTLTINIAHPGTPMQNDGTNNPGYSAVGHMWYELSDSNNTISSYGFAPDQDHHGQPFAPGDVYRDDSQNYLDRDYTRTVEITQEQYEAMKNFGEDPIAYGFDKNYDGADNSCIDFAWKALEIAGFNPLHIEGMWWPTWNGVAVDYSILVSALLGNTFEALKALGNGDEWVTHINELVDTLFRSSAHFTQPVRRDPLTLDLDNDGLETVGTSAGILFDHNADGVKTGTGWVKADDGLLVLDINGNGLIDTGRELFGDSPRRAQ